MIFSTLLLIFCLCVNTRGLQSGALYPTFHILNTVLSLHIFRTGSACSTWTTWETAGPIPTGSSSPTATSTWSPASSSSSTRSGTGSPSRLTRPPWTTPSTRRWPPSWRRRSAPHLTPTMSGWTAAVATQPTMRLWGNIFIIYFLNNFIIFWRLKR